jgi:hypothetical protein
MSAFIRRLSDDLHRGRESWRVIGVLSTLSFLVTVAIRLYGR